MTAGFLETPLQHCLYAEAPFRIVTLFSTKRIDDQILLTDQNSPKIVNFLDA